MNSNPRRLGLHFFVLLFLLSCAFSLPFDGKYIEKLFNEKGFLEFVDRNNGIKDMHPIDVYKFKTTKITMATVQNLLEPTHSDNLEFFMLWTFLDPLRNQSNKDETILSANRMLQISQMYPNFEQKLDFVWDIRLNLRSTINIMIDLYPITNFLNTIWSDYAKRPTPENILGFKIYHTQMLLVIYASIAENFNLDEFMKLGHLLQGTEPLKRIELHPEMSETGNELHVYIHANFNKEQVPIKELILTRQDLMAKVEIAKDASLEVNTKNVIKFYVQWIVTQSDMAIPEVIKFTDIESK